MSVKGERERGTHLDFYEQLALVVVVEGGVAAEENVRNDA